MSNTAQNLASTRITSLLDENSFVEIGRLCDCQKHRFQPEADSRHRQTV